MQKSLGMHEALAIIPTFNEIENIELMIHAVFALEQPFDILVVDDNSPDGTSEKVKELQSAFPERLHLVVRKEKSGLGTAYIHGFKWALEKNYNFIFEMDADFSHNPKDLLRLYGTCQKPEVDVVIGSRYVKGVNVVNWPLSRVLLSYLASIYVRVITGMKIYDTTAGFICYRREVLEAIELDDVKFIGYAFQIEMKFKAYLKKFKIVEIPIVFTDRVRGDSKLSGNIIYEAIFGVIKMKFKSLFGKE